jgi:hypothetical protein
MNNIYFIISSLLLIFLVFSCTERNDPVEVGTHPTEWNNSGSIKFHGKNVIFSGPGACQSCHGEDYQGGSSGVSCYDCHAGYPHPPGWTDSESEQFHGEVVEDSGPEQCQSCHGEDYNGGSSRVSCYDCHAGYPHPPAWTDPESEQFHGEVVEDSGPEQCQSCHGEDYQGGSSGVSCYSCHASYPHPDGFGDVESTAFHGEYFKVIANWELMPCQSCHGKEYTGKNTGLSCKNEGCHNSESGPEACNTCHGEFTSLVTNTQKWAPPKGLNDETDITQAAVGAHQVHLSYYSYLTGTLTCSECHIVPEKYSDEGHIDDSEGAEVIFDGELAVIKTQGENRVPMPVYNRSNTSCSEVYCHGNWGLLKSLSNNTLAYADTLIEGNTAVVSWVDTTTAACGTCHNIPPTGHSNFGPGACANCHNEVVNNNGEIIDNEKHANGKVNLFSSEYDMF